MVAARCFSLYPSPGDADVVCSLRAVRTSDYMSAKVYEFSWQLLHSISSRIVNEVDGVSRVTYDM